MKLRVFASFFVLLCLLGCGGSSKTLTNGGSVSSAVFAGNWNLVLTPTGGSTPTYTFGLQIAQSGGVITAIQIPVDLPIGYGKSCPSIADPVTAMFAAPNDLNVSITGMLDPRFGLTCTVAAEIWANGSSITGTYSDGTETGSAIMTHQ